MEEIREAALAYYENGSAEQKCFARDLFDCLDENGDGKVNVHEVVNILVEESDELVDYSSFFQELGRDSHGNLDFNGFLTLFYVIKSRSRPFCDGCRIFLKGLFFTCVQCHESCKDTFDLCSKCYRGKEFSHEHDAFLDNYTLLAHKRLTTVGAEQQPNTSQTTSSGTKNSDPKPRKSKSKLSSASSRLTRAKPKHEKVREAFEALNTGFPIKNYVNSAADACGIM